MDKKRFKLQYMFWLEPDKPEQDELIELIEELKESRLFAPVVRDGIMIEADLRRGRVDALLKAHPWVASVIIAQQGNDEVERLRNEVDMLKSVVAYMTNELEQGRALPPPTPTPTPGPQLLRPPAPADTDDADDGLLVVRKAESDGKQSAMAFLDSAFSLANK